MNANDYSQRAQFGSSLTRYRITGTTTRGNNLEFNYRPVAGSSSAAPTRIPVPIPPPVRSTVNLKPAEMEAKVKSQQPTLPPTSPGVQPPSSPLKLAQGSTTWQPSSSPLKSTFSSSSRPSGRDLFSSPSTRLSSNYPPRSHHDRIDIPSTTSAPLPTIESQIQASNRALRTPISHFEPFPSLPDPIIDPLSCRSSPRLRSQTSAPPLTPITRSSPRRSERTRAASKPPAPPPKPECIELLSEGTSEDEVIESPELHRSVCSKFMIGGLLCPRVELIIRENDTSIDIHLSRWPPHHIQFSFSHRSIRNLRWYDNLFTIDITLNERLMSEPPLLRGLDPPFLNDIINHFDDTSIKDVHRNIRFVWSDATEFPGPAIFDHFKTLSTQHDFRCWQPVTECIEHENTSFEEVYRSFYDNRGGSMIATQSSSTSTRLTRSKHLQASTFQLTSIRIEYRCSTEPDETPFILTTDDINRLRPNEFLNDTLIDVWVKYLITERYPERRADCYCFNSFFWTKISSGAEKELGNWTQTVDIFSKKYLFIPVCEHLHWTMVLVVLPSLDTSDRGCLMWFDSLSHRGKPSSKFQKIRSYLVHEYRSKKITPSDNNELDLDSEAEDYCNLLNDLPMRTPYAPQQTNYTDCGLFVLQFIEELLKLSPTPPYPLPKDIHILFPYLNQDEFRTVVSAKRAEIIEFIQDLRKKANQPLIDFPPDFFAPTEIEATLYDDETKDPSFIPSDSSRDVPILQPPSDDELSFVTEKTTSSFFPPKQGSSSALQPVASRTRGKKPGATTARKPARSGTVASRKASKPVSRERTLDDHFSSTTVDDQEVLAAADDLIQIAGEIDIDEDIEASPPFTKNLRSSPVIPLRDRPPVKTLNDELSLSDDDDIVSIPEVHYSGYPLRKRPERTPSSSPLSSSPQRAKKKTTPLRTRPIDISIDEGF